MFLVCLSLEYLIRILLNCMVFNNNLVFFSRRNCKLCYKPRKVDYCCKLSKMVINGNMKIFNFKCVSSVLFFLWHPKSFNKSTKHVWYLVYIHLNNTDLLSFNMCRKLSDFVNWRKRLIFPALKLVNQISILFLI